MVRTLRFALVAWMSCAGAGYALTQAAPVSQDWQGKNKIAGKAVDQAGKPVEGVTVKLLFLQTRSGTEAVTGKKGEWKVERIAAGMWTVEFYKDGFDPRQIQVEVGGQSKDPNIGVTMTPEGTDPGFAVKSAAEKAQILFDQRKYEESRAVIEPLITKYPKVSMLHVLLSRAYDAEKNYTAAADQLQEYANDNPGDNRIKTFLGTEYIKAGKLPEAWQVYSSVDLAQIQDAVDLNDPGFTLLRAKNPAEAYKYFDLTVKRFPQEPTAYYYRGLAAWQVGATVEKAGSAESRARLDLAKADLTKFLEMAPNAPEVANAKKMLEQIR